MTGSLITTSKDATTGLSYAAYLVKYKNRFWIATFDIDHQMLVQVQGVSLSEERVPDHVRQAVREWLL